MNRTAPKEMRKGINSLVILVAWGLWKHRNRCVFDGGTPRQQQVLLAVTEEARVWKLARATKLALLLDNPPELVD